MVAFRMASVGGSGSLATGYPPPRKARCVTYSVATGPAALRGSTADGDHEHARQFFVPPRWSAERAAELLALANALALGRPSHGVQEGWRAQSGSLPLLVILRDVSS